jgi:hypothetical protein
LTTSNTRKYGLSGKKPSTNSSLSSVSGLTSSPIPSTLSGFTPSTNSSAPSTQSSSAISSIRTLTSNGKSKKS